MEKKNLEKIKRLLIVVDMVNGFIREGKLADPSVGHIIPEIVRLIEEVKNDPETMIAFIKDCHKPGCREFNTFPEHCLEGTTEAELVAELKPYEKDALVYYKNSTSAIFAPGFMTDIERLKSLREVILTGCEIDICVQNLGIPLNNYFDQFNRNVDIVVPLNAVETFDGLGHNREEYRDIATKTMQQAGLRLVKKYKPNGGR